MAVSVAEQVLELAAGTHWLLLVALVGLVQVAAPVVVVSVLAGGQEVMGHVGQG